MRIQQSYLCDMTATRPTYLEFIIVIGIGESFFSSSISLFVGFLLVVYLLAYEYVCGVGRVCTRYASSYLVIWFVCMFFEHSRKKAENKNIFVGRMQNKFVFFGKTQIASAPHLFFRVCQTAQRLQWNGSDRVAKFAQRIWWSEMNTCLDKLRSVSLCFDALECIINFSSSICIEFMFANMSVWWCLLCVYTAVTLPICDQMIHALKNVIYSTKSNTKTHSIRIVSSNSILFILLLYFVVLARMK